MSQSFLDSEHYRWRGDAGGTVFFGSHANDGALYEMLDEDMKVMANVTLEGLVADWEASA